LPHIVIFIEMKLIYPFIFAILLFSCSPKGPQTYSSPLVGKSKNQLIAKKGVAQKIKIYQDSEIYIYTVKEEYFGSKNPEIDKNIKPTKAYEIEHIYYINAEQVVYKYQVWKKKISTK